MNKHIQRGFSSFIIKEAVDNIKIAGAKIEAIKNLVTGAKNYAALGVDVVGGKAKTGIDYAFKNKRKITKGIAIGTATLGTGIMIGKAIEKD